MYRDPADPAPKPSPRSASADDASYWYDLLAEDPVPPHEEARGPFEPLQSSHAPAGQPPGGQAQPPSDAAREGNPEPPEQAQARKLEQLRDLYLTAEAIGERNVDKHFDQLLAQQRELISEYFRQSPAARPGDASPAGGPAPTAEPEHQQPEHQQPEHQQAERQQAERQQAERQQAEHQQAEHQQAAGPATPPEGVSVRAEPPRAW